MPIKLTCPKCRRSLYVPTSDAGKPALCNACGQRLQIPRMPLSTRDLAKLDVSADAVSDPGLSRVPVTASPVPSKKFSSSPDEAEVSRSRVPVWIGGGVALAFIGTLIGWVIHSRTLPDWEAAHRAAIIAMINEADSAVLANNVRVAARKYQDAETLVGDHVITDPQLRTTVTAAMLQKQKILAALVEQATSRPAVAMSQPSIETDASPAAVIPATLPATTQPTAAIIAGAASFLTPASQPTTAPVISLLHVSKPVITPPAVNDERIGLAIEKGADWLLQRFDPKAHQLAGGPGQRRTSTVYGGLDALCVYALAQCGMAIHDDRLDIRKETMKGMLAALDTVPIERDILTYGHGLRATALALHDRKEDRKTLQMDMSWLLKNQKGGGYDYGEPNGMDHWDNSNSQYGLLGVWAGAEIGLEVPTAYWNLIQKHWVDCQSRDGGWGYTFGSPTLSMTLAGTASLFVCHDYLESVQFAGNVGRPPFSPALAKALQWLEQGDLILDNGGSWGYTLYGVERVGLASGFKFFGKHDWFRERALGALDLQQPDGSWGNNEVDTAYALLFLARGRHPILMNKLRFDGFWANRPRDVANLARFASKELERPLNFQVVSAERPWTDWTDSPILYLASHVAPKLTDGQIDNIRQFIEAGGLLYTQADGGQPAFDQYAAELAKKLFPQYPMTAVPKDHLVYSMLYKIDPPPPLKMVSNGVRALMIHSSQDLAMAWQGRMEKTRAPAFQLGLNLFLYAAGKGDLRNRVSSNAIDDAPEVTGGTMRMLQLKHSGNWNPEPAAWPRFAKWFQQETGCGLHETPVELDAIASDDAPFAHLTGATSFEPTAAQIIAVQKYVDGGGTLLIDAAGGNAAFSASAAQLLSKAFPDATLKKLPATHSIYTAPYSGMDALATVPALRSYTQTHLGKDAGALEGFAHGKGHVLYTSIDLTSGLLGTHTWGIFGFNPPYAQSLLKNTLLWVAIR